MITYKINHAKSTIPLAISKGTTAQRMQKARVLNLAFYDKLQGAIKNNQIAPRTFVSKLRSIIGAKPGIYISEVDSNKNCYTNYCFDAKAKSLGYTIGLPWTDHTQNIHKNNAAFFLKQTQNLLNELFNPKIFSRFIALANSGENIDSILSFYDTNLSQKANLEPEILDKFLENKSNKQKINTLQFLRYKLLSEQNTTQASYQIDKRIEKHNGFRYQRPENYYDMEQYHYENKLRILNENLAEVLQNERND